MLASQSFRLKQGEEGSVEEILSANGFIIESEKVDVHGCEVIWQGCRFIIALDEGAFSFLILLDEDGDSLKEDFANAIECLRSVSGLIQIDEDWELTYQSEGTIAVRFYVCAVALLLGLYFVIESMVNYLFP